jgi:hypothetical protein
MFFIFCLLVCGGVLRYLSVMHVLLAATLGFKSHILEYITAGISDYLLWDVSWASMGQCGTVAARYCSDG